MKSFVFLANDPGGIDSIYPVAEEMSKQDNVFVKLMLTGRAAERYPLFKNEEQEIMLYLNNNISNGENFLLITGTSWNSVAELNAIRLCKSHGIKTVSILDYWCNYKSRFAHNEEFVFPDYYLVMDKLAVDEASNEGVDPIIMRIVGTPGLDYYVRKRKRNKRVLFLSQPISESLSYESEGYTEFDAFEGVVKACEELRIEPYIKFHPKETQKMKNMYGHMSIEGKLEELAFEYDVVIGMSTMGLLQCSLMGVPVISYEPNLKSNDKCIINKLEITQGAYNYNELLAQLKTITGSVDERVLPFWFDGKSTERCINELFKIYEGR